MIFDFSIFASCVFGRYDVLEPWRVPSTPKGEPYATSNTLSSENDEDTCPFLLTETSFMEFCHRVLHAQSVQQTASLMPSGICASSLPHMNKTRSSSCYRISDGMGLTTSAGAVTTTTTTAVAAVAALESVEHLLSKPFPSLASKTFPGKNHLHTSDARGAPLGAACCVLWTVASNTWDATRNNGFAFANGASNAAQRPSKINITPLGRLKTSSSSLPPPNRSAGNCNSPWHGASHGHGHSNGHCNGHGNGNGHYTNQSKDMEGYGKAGGRRSKSRGGQVGNGGGVGGMTDISTSCRCLRSCTNNKRQGSDDGRASSLESNNRKIHVVELLTYLANSDPDFATDLYDKAVRSTLNGQPCSVTYRLRDRLKTSPCNGNNHHNRNGNGNVYRNGNGDCNNYGTSSASAYREEHRRERLTSLGVPSLRVVQIFSARLQKGKGSTAVPGLVVILREAVCKSCDGLRMMVRTDAVSDANPDGTTTTTTTAPAAAPAVNNSTLVATSVSNSVRLDMTSGEANLLRTIPRSLKPDRERTDFEQSAKRRADGGPNAGVISTASYEGMESLVTSGLPCCLFIFELSEAEFVIRPQRLLNFNHHARDYLGCEHTTDPRSLPAMLLLREIFSQQSESLEVMLAAAATSEKGFDAIVEAPSHIGAQELLAATAITNDAVTAAMTASTSVPPLLPSPTLYDNTEHHQGFLRCSTGIHRTVATNDQVRRGRRRSATTSTQRPTNGALMSPSSAVDADVSLEGGNGKLECSLTSTSSIHDSYNFHKSIGRGNLMRTVMHVVHGDCNTDGNGRSDCGGGGASSGNTGDVVGSCVGAREPLSPPFPPIWEVADLPAAPEAAFEAASAALPSPPHSPILPYTALLPRPASSVTTDQLPKSRHSRSMVTPRQGSCLSREVDRSSSVAAAATVSAAVSTAASSPYTISPLPATVPMQNDFIELKGNEGGCGAAAAAAATAAATICPVIAVASDPDVSSNPPQIYSYRTTSCGWSEFMAPPMDSHSTSTSDLMPRALSVMGRKAPYTTGPASNASARTMAAVSPPSTSIDALRLWHAGITSMPRPASRYAPPRRVASMAVLAARSRTAAIGTAAPTGATAASSSGRVRQYLQLPIGNRGTASESLGSGSCRILAMAAEEATPAAAADAEGDLNELADLDPIDPVNPTDPSDQSRIVAAAATAPAAAAAGEADQAHYVGSVAAQANFSDKVEAQPNDHSVPTPEPLLACRPASVQLVPGSTCRDAATTEITTITVASTTTVNSGLASNTVAAVAPSVSTTPLKIAATAAPSSTAMPTTKKASLHRTTACTDSASLGTAAQGAGYMRARSTGQPLPYRRIVPRQGSGLRHRVQTLLELLDETETANGDRVSVGGCVESNNSVVVVGGGGGGDSLICSGPRQGLSFLHEDQMSPSPAGRFSVSCRTEYGGESLLLYTSATVTRVSAATGHESCSRYPSALHTSAGREADAPAPWLSDGGAELPCDGDGDDGGGGRGGGDGGFHEIQGVQRRAPSQRALTSLMLSPPPSSPPPPPSTVLKKLQFAVSDSDASGAAATTTTPSGVRRPFPIRKGSLLKSLGRIFNHPNRFLLGSPLTGSMNIQGTGEVPVRQRFTPYGTQTDKRSGRSCFNPWLRRQLGCRPRHRDVKEVDKAEKEENHGSALPYILTPSMPMSQLQSERLCGGGSGGGGGGSGGGGGGCAVCPSPVGTPRDSRSRTHSGDCSSGGGGVIRRVLRWCGGSTGSGAATWSILGVSPSGAAGGTTLNEKSGNDRKGDGAGDEVGDDIFSTVGDRGGGGGGGNIATTAGSCSGGGGIRSFFCRSSGPGTEVDTAGFLSSSIMFSLERVASGGAGGGCPSATATVNVGYTVPPPGAAATLAASPDPRDIPDNVAAASDRASHPAVLLKMKERMSRRWRGTAPAAVDEACSGTERSPVSPNAVHQDAESIEQTRLPAGDNHELDLSVRKISPVKEVPTSIALPMSAAAAAAAVAANAAGQGGVHHDQHHDGGKNYPPVKVTSIANGAAVASFPQSRRNEISPLTVTYPGVPSRINEPWATYRCSSLSSGRRGAVQSSYTVKPPTAHYRIQAWQSQDPDSGRSLLMMTMHDVTTAVQVRNRAVRLLLQEHRILESLFPRHVLTFLVLNPEALGTQNRPDEDLLLDGVAARRCSNSGPDTTSVKCANASETTAPLVAGELESLQQQSRRKTAEVDSGSETPAVVIEQSQPMHTVRRMLAARQLATARVSQLATIHKMVTILIMDCVGFTSMCRQVEPRQVMHFLNELYSRFDALLDIYKVVKVETIGDAYVVAGGLVRYDTDGFRCVLPEGEVDHLHAVRVVEFARAMLRAARGLTLPHTGEAVMLRLGVHSGALMSGVVGTKQPRFTVFGETVELAKRVESAGVPGRIHVSTTTHALLTATAQTVATAATKRPKWESRLHGGGSSYGSGVSGGYRWEVTAPTAGSSCSSSTVHGSASSSGSVIPGQSHQGGTTEGLSMPAPGAASYTTKAPTTAPGGYLLIDEAGDSAEALQRVAAVYL